MDDEIALTDKTIDFLKNKTGISQEKLLKHMEKEKITEVVDKTDKVKKIR